MESFFEKRDENKINGCDSTKKRQQTPTDDTYLLESMKELQAINNTNDSNKTKG